MTTNEIIDALKKKNHFLVLTHVRPDGDTVCSAAALCSALRRAGKKAVMYRNPGITDRYVPLAEPYFGDIPENPCVIAVDVADVRMFPEGWEGDVDICIDHHPLNPGFAPITYVDGSKASCGEIIMDVIVNLCGTLNKEEAMLLYVAVSTDSGCFCYGNTTAETLRAAARLIDCGAENAKLNKLFFRSYTLARLRLEGMIYAGLQSFRDGMINIAVVTLEMLRECGATEDDCEDLASVPGRICGSIVNVLIREIEPGRCKVSVRTTEEVDASAICGRFGGGGHKMASGCTLNIDPEIAAILVQSAINEVWPE